MKAPLMLSDFLLKRILPIFEFYCPLLSMRSAFAENCVSRLDRVESL